MRRENPGTIRTHVRKSYGEVATNNSGCCGPKSTGGGCCGTAAASKSASSNTLGYDPAELAAIPDGSDLGLGCGNPVALADLRPGETVLDLGSGGGIDCFLAAERVGPTGRVIGVDMTAEMIDRARRNAAEAGADTVEFRLGEIEHLPVADNSVDVILSNCVINLSPQKDAVIAEAFRVLKPGGRLRVSDIVATAPIPEDIRNDLTSISGCVGNAARIDDLKRMLQDAGFVDVAIDIKDQGREMVSDWSAGGDAGRYVASASIIAAKPANQSALRPTRNTL